MSESKLTDLSYLRDLMQRHGITAKKKYGQNFLVNAAIPKKIAQEGCPESEAGVLEIGPGMGTLTYELCRRAKKEVALEIDQTLLPVLEETLAEFDNIQVISGDAMKTDLVSLCQKEFSECSEIFVCANLPYYITTPLLMRLLECGAPFKSITVMLQKEVADRITAKAGSAEYGAITAAVKYFGTAVKLFSVSPGSFFPMPKVESCVMQIRIHEHNPYAACNKEVLFNLISSAFEQRRKTLLNALKGSFSEKQRQLIREELPKMGFSEDVRGEKLDVEDFAHLAKLL